LRICRKFVTYNMHAIIYKLYEHTSNVVQELYEKSTVYNESTAL